jgi:hypothetical protein
MVRDIMVEYYRKNGKLYLSGLRKYLPDVVSERNWDEVVSLIGRLEKCICAIPPADPEEKERGLRRPIENATRV